MTKFGTLMVAVAFAVLVVLFPKISALQCWLCTTDAPNPAFCDDPFNENTVTEILKRWTYVNCSSPPEESGLVAACKKAIHWINDKKVVSRSCSWELPQDPRSTRDSCFSAKTPSYIKMEFCKTCTTDGCNAMSDDHHEDNNSTSPLKCWRCSTNSTNPAFCDDPFDVTTITEQQRRWTYVECGSPPSISMTENNQTVIPVCKKVIQLINNTERVLQRSCDWEDKNAPQDSCNRMDTSSASIKTEFCKTCATDGCNV